MITPELEVRLSKNYQELEKILKNCKDISLVSKYQNLLNELLESYNKHNKLLNQVYTIRKFNSTHMEVCSIEEHEKYVERLNKKEAEKQKEIITQYINKIDAVKKNTCHVKTISYLYNCSIQ